jgi:cytochrome c-type biogenesis protein
MLKARAMSDSGSQPLLAFAAGLLSVLSPCVLPLLPAYLSLISGITVEELREAPALGAVRRRVMSACLGFVSGFSLVFVVMGLGAVGLGQLLRTARWQVFGFEFGVAQIAGLVVILFGLHMTGLVPLRLLYRDTRLQLRAGQHGFASALLIGAGFALGWSPCIGPILATILTLAGTRESAFEGAWLLAIYSAGLAVPFLVAGWSVERFFHAFQHIKRYFRALEVTSGLVLMSVGVLLVTDRLSSLNSRFQVMTEWLSAAEKALQ